MRNKFNTYYILDGKTPVPVEDVREWAEKFEFAWQSDKNRVGEYIDGDIRVSTAFLGINHGMYDDLPLLFETMIFGGGDDLNEYQERYTTWEQAEEGHKRAIEMVKKTKVTRKINLN